MYIFSHYSPTEYKLFYFVSFFSLDFIFLPLFFGLILSYLLRFLFSLSFLLFSFRFSRSQRPASAACLRSTAR